LHSVFRPRIGLGIGTMTYYGEIQNQQKGFAPIVNRYGGILYINAPLTNFFNFEFAATYAKIAANERTLTRNLNFESRLRMASFSLYYNFYPMFKKERGFFHPYIGVGVSSFEFLSKTDLYSRQGEMYYYWSDGSIKNLAENDINAANAIDIERDYRYETDLRELDLDSLGKYKEQSFGFPLTVGIEFHLSPRWDFRIAMAYSLTLTDLIDNISSVGVGVRKGDPNKDRFVFTYFSLSYDLQFGKKAEDGGLGEDDIPLFADWDQNDSDKDGVIDALDKCAGTPLAATVDSLGCAEDDDDDGVPNYRDDEPNTPEGNFVDKYGVTETEEQIARHWELYNDSTGYAHDFVELRTLVTFGEDNVTEGDNTIMAGRNYVIIIASWHRNDPAPEFHQYVGFDDYKIISRGDSMHVVIGQYEKIEDAVAAMTGLENNNVPVKLISRDNVENGSMTRVDLAVIEKVIKVNEDDNKTIPTFGTGTIFRVQIGAFKKKINLKTSSIGRAPDLVFGTGSDGLTRYYSGKFKTYSEAEAHRKKLGPKFKNSFVVAYEGQVAKPLDEVVHKDSLRDSYDPQKDRDNMVDGGHSSKIDMSRVKYHVKLGSYAAGEKVPMDVFDVLTSIPGGVIPVKSFDGTTNYYSKEGFNTAEERDAAIKDYKRIYELEMTDKMLKYDGKWYSPSQWKDFIRNN